MPLNNIDQPELEKKGHLVQKNSNNTLIDNLTSLDYQTFARRKNKIYNKIIGNKNTLSEDDLHIITHRLREHDIESGFALAQRLQWTKDDYIGLFYNMSFVAKHKDFLREIMGFLERRENIVHNHNKKYLESILRMKIHPQLSPDYHHKHKHTIILENNKEMSHHILLGSLGKEILNELDAIYAIPLSQKEFAPVKNNTYDSRGMILGEQYLATVANAGKYHVPKIIEVLYQELCSRDTTRKKSESISYTKQLKHIVKKLKEREITPEMNKLAQNLSYKNITLISGKEIENIMHMLDIHPSEELTKKIKSTMYQPLGVTFHSQNYLAEKYNKEELITLLQEDFGDTAKLEYNITEKRYEVVFAGENERAKIVQDTNIYIPDELRSIHFVDDSLYSLSDFKGKTVQFLTNEEGEIIGDDTWLKSMTGFISRKERLYCIGTLANGNKSIGNPAGIKLSPEFHDIKYLVKTDDNLFFVGILENGKHAVFTLSGVQFSPEFEHIHTLISNGSQLFFVGMLKDGKHAIFQGSGERISPEFLSIDEIICTNNHIFYIRKKENGKCEVIRHTIGSQNHRSISGEYNEIHNLTNIDGEIFFTEKKLKDDRYTDTIISSKGKRIIPEGGFTVQDISYIDKEMFFTAYLGNGKYAIFNKEGKQISQEFQYIRSFRNIKDSIFFIGAHDFTGDNAPYKITLTTDKPQLTPYEQNKLDFLNMCTNIDEKPGHIEEFQQEIESYFLEKEQREYKSVGSNYFKYKAKDLLSRSTTFAKMMTQSIKNFPALFIDTISPYKYNKKAELISHKIIAFIFPETCVNDSIHKGISHHTDYVPDAADYLSYSESTDLYGGDPESLEGYQDVLLLRDHIDNIIITNIFGEADDENGSWNTVDFSVFTGHIGVKTEKTIVLPNIRKGRITLPKPQNSTILLQRVKGIKDGKEIPLEVQTNALGISKVLVDSEIDQISYSISELEGQLPIPSISSDRYTLFAKEFDKKYGSGGRSGLLTNIVDFDTETDYFIQSLGHKTIKEKLIEIEAYVRKYSYYDMKNSEVTEQKKDKSPQERVWICEERVKELAATGEIDGLAEKKWAGVCADFALITTALLRKAGILSGVVQGFLPADNTKSITTRHAHACSFAVVPTQTGENQVVILDGTPPISGMAQPSLIEKEQKMEEELQTIELNTYKDLSEIEHIIEQNQGDISNIQNLIAGLHNGDLEDALNTILSKRIDTENYKRITNILNAYNYSGTKDITFIQSQINKVDNTFEFSTHEAGTQLFDTVKTFIEKSSQQGEDGYRILGDLISSIKSSLSLVEYTAVELISKYLKAEKVMK